MSDFELVWLQFLPLTDGADMKEIAELFFRKGLCEGKESVLSEIRPLVSNLTLEEAQKVEAATIGETVRHGHLRSVIDAQKQLT